MTTLASYYALAAQAPAQHRRYALGAGYSLYERVAWGESYASARARLMSLPQYANALTAAGLDDDLALVDDIGQAFTPSAISGLTLQLRADDLSIGSVASWSDQSGAGRTFTAAGAAQPTVVANQFGSLPGVQFTTDDVMTTAATTAQLTTNSQFTIFYVVKLTGPASSVVASYENDALLAEVGGNMGTHVKDNAGTPAILGFNWDGNEDVASQNATYNNALLIRHDHDNVNVRVSVNKAAAASVASGQSTGASNATWRIGQSFSSGNFLEAVIGEILVYNRLLSAGEITQVQGYLARWGV